MNFTAISNLIEPQTENLDSIKASITEVETQIKEIPQSAYEDLGTLHYSLMRLKLKKGSLLEDEKMKSDLESMTQSFIKHEQSTQKTLSDRTVSDSMRNITRLQLKAFYKLVNSYYDKLEKEFSAKNFGERKSEAYFARMRFKENGHRLNHNFTRYFLFIMWRWTSSYGESFIRWGITNLIAVTVFTSMFFIIGELESPKHLMLKGAELSKLDTFINYFYFGIITFTTVGYGDIAPISIFQKLIAITQALMGYLLLGIFLTLLQRKL